MTTRLSPCVLIAIALFPVPASLAATYRATGILTQTFATSTTALDSYDRTGFADTGDQAKYDDFDNNVNAFSFHASATSLAGPTGLHAAAHAQVLQPSQFGGTSSYSLTGTSAAQGTWVDFIISAPPGTPNPPATVTTSINVHLDGSDIVGSTSTPAGTTFASTDTQLVFFYNGQNIGGGYFDAVASNGGPVSYTSSGPLANFNGNAVVTSPTFTAPLNTPFAIQISLSAFAGVSTTRDDQSIDLVANCDFGDTLTFATDRPVFNLPAGYTISSADANILDNSFSLPEPTTLFLLPAAATMLAARRRKWVSERRRTP